MCQLQMSPEGIADLKSELGIATVWSEDGPAVHEPNPRRRLLRELAGRLLDANFTYAHRADNWYRGLADEQQPLVTQSINHMIELGALLSSSAPAGLHIQVNENAQARLRPYLMVRISPPVSTNYGVNSSVSRSKIFKGRPDRLLIDQRAILAKMPDFTDAPPLEEPEPDDFGMMNYRSMKMKKRLKQPHRVFIGTANIFGDSRRQQSC